MRGSLMSWSYAYDPEMWPSLAIVALTCVLGAYSWRRRREPGALPFAFACLFAMLWALGSALEITATDLSGKILWYVFKALWLLPMVCAVTGFVLQYAGLGRWLTRRVVVWLFALPSVLFAALAVTNTGHLLVWPELVGADFAVSAPSTGVVVWVALAYHLLLALFNFAVLGWLFVVSATHRRPVGLMIVGQVVARVAFAFELFGHQRFLTADPEVAAIGVPVTLYAIALFGFHVFDPVPWARAAAIEQMRDAMVVLDPDERIVFANPAAERLLGVPLPALQGRLGTEVLPPAAQLRSGSEPGETTSLRLGVGDAGRDLRVTTTALTDSIGQSVGRMLLVRDVTDEHRVQAYLLDEQRALATLRERERLARELHDSVGQVLGYVSMQAQAADKWLRENDVPRATALIGRLTEVAQQAHADIREAIQALKVAPPATWSFLAALREYAGDFERQHGITTVVTTEENVAAVPFDPGTGVQVLRVVQEAMTNARKHGRPRTVRIHLVNEGSAVRITISDDGEGMVSEVGNGPATGHFGITFMRERMAEIGGSVELSSEPGVGTQVLLRIPLHSQGDGG